jgi:uncharacterized protein (DUF1697 family)
MSQAHVALLRGINVGGRNKLPMKQLAALFEEVGCDDVRTYIQSGNVVFTAPAKVAAKSTTQVPKLILERVGMNVPIVLRSAAEFQKAVARNPFLAGDADPTHLHVGFLATRPSAGAVASLDAARSDIDRFEVLGSEVYLHVPGGMGRTKLTSDYFDRRLGTVMTVRNWRTVNKLLEMVEG